MTLNYTYLITGANRGGAPITPFSCMVVFVYASLKIAGSQSGFCFPCLHKANHNPSSGIGLAITSILLLRPDTTVITTIRTPSTPTTTLTSLTVAGGSKLLIVPLDFSNPSSSAEKFSAFLDTLTKVHGISHINTIIANAGVGSSFLSSKDTPLSSLTEYYETNTLGPILLYQTLYSLLTAKIQDEGDEERKFVLISSSLGSIGAMEGAVPSLAYGVSKAAANYFVRKVHFEEKGIVAMAVHPG
mgnify:CR=1 FL=1